MKTNKLVTIALSILLASTATIGAYFGLGQNNNASSKYQNSIQKDSLNKLKYQSNEKKYKSLNQYFDLDSKYLKAGGNNRVATHHDTNYYKALIDHLKSLKKNVSPSDVALVPSNYYNNFVKSNEMLTSLTYKGLNYNSVNYELVDSLNLKIMNNAKDRNVIASFIDYMKSTIDARKVFYKNMPNLAPFLNNLNISNNQCFNYNLMKNDDNSLKAAMGSIYYVLNCRQGYSFNNFNLDEFLSTFLELNPTKVIVGEKPKDYNGKMQYMSLDQAKRYSNKDDIKIGDEITVYSSFINLLSKLSLDKLKLFSNIGAVLKSKVNVSDNSGSVSILDKIIEDNSKIDTVVGNTLIAVLLTLIGSVSKTYNDAKTKFHFNSSIKDGDIIKVLMSSAQTGLFNIIKNLLYGDTKIISFFFNSKLKNKNSDLKAIDLVKKDYMNQNKKNLFDAKIQNALLQKKKKQVEVLKIRIKELRSNKKVLETFEDWTNYVTLERLIANEKFDISISRENHDILTTLMKSYQKQIDFFANDPTQTLKIKELKIKISQLKIDIATIDIQTENKVRLLNKLQDRLKRIESSHNYKETVKTNKDLIASINEKNRLTKEIDSLTSDIIKKRKLIKANTNKINKINIWNSTNDSTKGLLAIKSLDFEDALTLFIDVISEVTYDAMASLKLGSYDKNGEFKFSGFKYSGIGDLPAISPFFKEKGAINVINKLIELFNSIVSKFTNNSLKAASKFLLSLLPDSLFKLLNLNFSFGDIKVNFRNGIDIKQYQVHGYIGAGGALGGVAGSILGGITAGLKSKSFKGGLFGALIGFGVGLGVGLTSSGAALPMLFGDGNLKIIKPNKNVIDIILDLKKQSKKKDISFNLFLDGHTLLKEVFIPELNKTFQDLAKQFTFSNPDVFSKIENFSKKYQNKKFKGWELTGEIMKMFVLSPAIWKSILESKAYVRNEYEAAVFKKEIISKIRKELTYNKSLLKYLSKEKSETYLNDLYQLQFNVIDWLLSSTYVTNDTPYLKGHYKSIKIGYDSNEIDLKDLQSLEDGFRKLTKVETDIIWVNTSIYGYDNLDAYFNYKTMSPQMLNVAKTRLFILQKMAREPKEVNIPLFKTSYVPVTTIYNRIQNIDHNFIVRNFGLKN